MLSRSGTTTRCVLGASNLADRSDHLSVYRSIGLSRVADRGWRIANSRSAASRSADRWLHDERRQSRRNSAMLFRQAGHELHRRPLVLQVWQGCQFIDSVATICLANAKEQRAVGAKTSKQNAPPVRPG